MEASRNFRRVSDTVTTSGIVSADDLASLKERGYAVVVNLLPDSHDDAVEDEASIVGEQGIEYVHIPVDFAAPTLAELDEFVAVMDAHTDAPIHVHCAANYRVSVFYALYAARRGLWTLEEADAHIADVWEPNAVWQELIASARRSRR
jgi:uncharacterized protein (TIGR01244 family)